MKGKIIVFEGLDGCGKTTQVEKFKKYLEQNNIKYRFIKFPVYNNNVATPIKEYLNGSLNADAYQVSAFYATDRLYSYLTDWKKDYEEGMLILMDRYTYSNAIFQSARFEKFIGAQSYIKWLENYEFNILNLPKPDVTIFLDIDPNTSQLLMSERYNGDESKKDVHEKDMLFQKRCRGFAHILANEHKWNVVRVDNCGHMRTVEDISNEIIERIDYFVKK